jgi:hypothetical protein
MGTATVLDPRLKTLSLLMCLEWLLGMIGQVCEDKVALVMDLLWDLMIEYHVEVVEVEETTAAPSTSNLEFLSSFSVRVASTRPESMMYNSELERYLEDGLVPLDTKGFNVRSRYPTLRRIV